MQKCHVVYSADYVFQEEGVMGEPPEDNTMAEKKIFMKRKKSVRREVTKSLSDFLREESKKQLRM